jgi:hypothetical protein
MWLLLRNMPSEEAIEALRAKGNIIPSASVKYIMRMTEGMCRFDLCTDGKWHQSSSIRAPGQLSDPELGK